MVLAQTGIAQRLIAADGCRNGTQTLVGHSLVTTCGIAVATDIDQIRSCSHFHA